MNNQYSISEKIIDTCIFNAAPIRNKINIISILMNTMKLICSINMSSLQQDENGVIYIREGRIYIKAKDTITSIFFPFKIILESDGNVKFKHNLYGTLNIEIIEIILSVVVSKQSNFDDITSVIELFYDSDADFDNKQVELATKIFMSLLYHDDGYFRCDFDKKNEKDQIHPLHHIDFYYNNSTQFKIGLYGQMRLSELFTIIDKKTDCHYLDKFNKKKLNSGKFSNTKVKLNT